MCIKAHQDTCEQKSGTQKLMLSESLCHSSIQEDPWPVCLLTSQYSAVLLQQHGQLHLVTFVLAQYASRTQCKKKVHLKSCSYRIKGKSFSPPLHGSEPCSSAFPGKSPCHTYTPCMCRKDLEPQHCPSQSPVSLLLLQAGSCAELTAGSGSVVTPQREGLGPAPFSAEIPSDSHCFFLMYSLCHWNLNVSSLHIVASTCLEQAPDSGKGLLVCLFPGLAWQQS
jgi:hypothetical protein